MFILCILFVSKNEWTKRENHDLTCSNSANQKLIPEGRFYGWAIVFDFFQLILLHIICCPTQQRFPTFVARDNLIKKCIPQTELPGFIATEPSMCTDGNGKGPTQCVSNKPTTAGKALQPHCSSLWSSCGRDHVSHTLENITHWEAHTLHMYVCLCLKRFCASSPRTKECNFIMWLM